MTMHYVVSLSVMGPRGLRIAQVPLAPDSRAEATARRIVDQLRECSDSRMIVSAQSGPIPADPEDVALHDDRRLVIDMQVYSPGVSRSSFGPAFSGSPFESVFTRVPEGRWVQTSAPQPVAA